MRVFTIWTTYSGPTARELSDGLRPSQRPWGPWSPTPRPPKLAASVAGGRRPCAVCSIAALVGITSRTPRSEPTTSGAVERLIRLRYGRDLADTNHATGHRAPVLRVPTRRVVRRTS